jgi:hypothetical protein
MHAGDKQMPKDGLAIVLMGKKKKGEDYEKEDMEDDKHEITEGLESAAGGVRKAFESGDDKELAQALCDFLDVKDVEY